MFGRSDDLNSFLSPKEPGNSEHSNKCHREPTDQYHAPGRVPGTQTKESRSLESTQDGSGKEEKIKISTRYRGLPAEPGLSVARYSAVFQTTQLFKLIRFCRQQTWHLKLFHFPLFFFFRAQSGPSKGKTRRGGQCRRGKQKSDGDTLAESLAALPGTEHQLSFTCALLISEHLAHLQRSSSHHKRYCVPLLRMYQGSPLVPIGNLPHPVFTSYDRTSYSCSTTLISCSAPCTSERSRPVAAHIPKLERGGTIPPGLCLFFGTNLGPIQTYRVFQAAHPARYRGNLTIIYPLWKALIQTQHGHLIIILSTHSQLSVSPK
ncbi:uncharacterized protein LOC143785889 isoform X1 [Ranitomeya variabilis]|uniref:uncharacterized protein LOC143785889 isoform X1 n=1 Tax=Ranitomeya variabilis TaxID=490064 RepID=UPI004055BC1B